MLKRSPILVLASGLALFLLGVLVARTRLPEWRVGSIPAPSFFQQRFQEAATRAGLTLAGEPRAELTSTGVADKDLQMHRTDRAYRVLGTSAPDWLTANGRGPFVDMTGSSRRTAGTAGKGSLRIVFSARGEPISARWTPDDALSPKGEGKPDLDRQARTIAAVLDGRRLSPSAELDVLGGHVTIFPLPGTQPEECLVAAVVPGTNVLLAHRLIGSGSDLLREFKALDLSHYVRERVPPAVAGTLFFLGCLILFLVLVVRRRIDLVNGLILGIASLIFSIVPPVMQATGWLPFLDQAGSALGGGILVFIVWSAAESWVRSTLPGFQTNLDRVRGGRVGPRGGEALLVGWAFGAAIAGVSLMALTALTWMHGVSPGGSVHLPLFAADTSPVRGGVLRAGAILLVLGASLHFAFLRRLRVFTIVGGAFLLAARSEISWFSVSMLVAAVLAVLLVMTNQRSGLSGLLTASIVSFALPAALYAALHLRWLSGSFGATALLVIAPLALGLAGLRRSDDLEMAPIRMPAFARRLEEERRLAHEMELLARMQIGLLPLSTPVIAGYEVAARSVLATEAGGDLYDFLWSEGEEIWIAAGDVSGHGYSCAIAQAMTKAGLASLVASDQTPASVLSRLDRVLRTSGSTRTFTSLVLLRFNPASGEGVMANAGHPYPLLAANGDVRELSLTSLPLGQGPPRTYEDYPIHLEPGSVLVFYSDGLFEALDSFGVAYGFDRLRAQLAAAKDRPASEILTSLFDDWRSHVGKESPADDTTVVILKRL